MESDRGYHTDGSGGSAQMDEGIRVEFYDEYQKIKKSLPSTFEKVTAFIFLLFSVIICVVIIVEEFYGNSPAMDKFQPSVVLFVIVYFMTVSAFTIYVYTKNTKGKILLKEALRNKPGFSEYYYNMLDCEHKRKS